MIHWSYAPEALDNDRTTKVSYLSLSEIKHRAYIQFCATLYAWTIYGVHVEYEESAKS
jgi:hypothetical protein